ncbi:MAG: branched-chain amino acid ABC transporter permease, partial [Candidatus Thermoplasmatota archaeon]|nr:branched-chain amino acid ABC transporter permease [Candidatus Thermoplasmatota archaeon]
WERTEDVRFLTVLVVTLALFLSFAWRGSVPWSYLSRTYATILVYAIFTLGLSLQFAYCGLINFGHVASMALGAYALSLVTGQLPNPEEVTWLLSVLVGLVGWATLSMALWERLDWHKGLRALAMLAALVPVTWLFGNIWTLVLGVTSPNYVGGILTGLILAVGWSYLIGIPTLRLRDDYLAIVTIAAAEILRIIIRNEDTWTRGSAGILSIPFPLTWLRDLVDPIIRGAGVNVSVVLAALLAIALVGWLLNRLVKSPWGRLIKAVGDDEDAAEGIGAPVVSLKMQVLALGSAVAAISGVMLTWQNLAINPALFKPVPTFYAWAILILGGLGSLRGVVAGSAIFWAIWQAPRWMDLSTIGLTLGSQRVAALQIMLVGLLLMIVVVVKPEGLFGSREEMEVME